MSSPVRDRVDARQRLRRGRVDAAYAGVGEGAAEGLRPQHARDLEVGAVVGRAGYLVASVDAGYGRADDAWCGGHVFSTPAVVIAGVVRALLYRRGVYMRRVA